MLDIRNVNKSFGNHIAVNDISLTIPEGAIFGMLGPNGAGKTSLIRMITHITEPDRGEILFNGEKMSPRQQELIGYMPEERGLYKKMKVGEQLVYLARLKGLSGKQAKEATQYWMEKLHITDWWSKKTEELSKGMSQKLQFIATVVHQPKLIILDEPFSGLDPVNANLIKDEIFELHKKGASIIFSTHRMEQVEEICSSIILIHQGKKVLEGDVQQIRKAYKENVFELLFEGVFPEELNSQIQILTANVGKITFSIPENYSANDILLRFIQAGVLITGFREILPSLNEIFIKLVS